MINVNGLWEDVLPQTPCSPEPSITPVSINGSLLFSVVWVMEAACSVAVFNGGVLDLEECAPAREACDCGPCCSLCALPGAYGHEEWWTEKARKAQAVFEEHTRDIDECTPLFFSHWKKREKAFKKVAAWASRNLVLDFLLRDGDVHPLLLFPRLPMKGEAPGCLVRTFSPKIDCSMLSGEGCRLSREKMPDECKRAYGIDHRRHPLGPLDRHVIARGWNVTDSWQMSLLRLFVDMCHKRDADAMPVGRLEEFEPVINRRMMLHAVEWKMGMEFSRQLVRDITVYGNWSVCREPAKAGVLAMLMETVMRYPTWPTEQDSRPQNEKQDMMDGMIACALKDIIDEYAIAGSKRVKDRRAELQDVRQAQQLAYGMGLQVMARAGDAQARNKLKAFQKEQVRIVEEVSRLTLKDATL